MLSQEVEERLAERLVNRIEETNTFILNKIGEAIKKISTLSPSQAYQVSQILKYGGSYEEIAKELAKVSGKNVQDIYKIFEEVAKSNKQFAKEFYKYRGMDFIPYNKDIALQNQVESIARLTAQSYINISNTSMVGLVQDGQFKQLQQAYYDVIDKAVISLSQGKEDFYSSMRNTLKELGSNGLVEYRSGYKRRLDSSVRMNILDGIRQLNNETTKRFGAEYDADGIEISVHSNPAPDHADIQGRQFSNEQYDILESGGIATDVKGNKYDGADKRHISELNCYHKIFTIVIGVSKPEYTDEQLKKIQEDNEKGFEFEGKHYTNYEGTQLQRRIETEIRKQKDTQILAKAAGDMELVGQCQNKITILTHKYNDLCKASGLKPKKQRMSVSGYVRTKVDNIKNKIIVDELHPETLVGVPLQKEMTFEEANGGKVNPNYNKDASYNTNCQSCVVTYEARRRGYNVQAKPNLYKLTNNPSDYTLQNELASDMSLAYFKKGTLERPEITEIRAGTINDAYNKIDKFVEEDKRYQISMKWKSQDSSHIMSIYRNKDNILEIYDAQSGEIFTSNSIKLWRLNHMEIGRIHPKTKKYYPIKIMRVDNLVIDERTAEFIMEAKK